MSARSFGQLVAAENLATVLAVADADVSEGSRRAHRRQRRRRPLRPSLGVLCGWRTEARMAFDVPPQAFTPPPKVTSTVVHLVPRENPFPALSPIWKKVTQAAFGQRRKMLRQSLKSLGGERLLVKAGIDPARRAETLSVEEFCLLANSL
ncbi:ribosomal RNA small subunit methyltransferase A [Rhizobium beringeri]